MFYKANELAERYHKVCTELESLKVIYGDFKTLNSSMANNRQAIRNVVDALTEEKTAIENALKTVEVVL